MNGCETSRVDLWLPRTFCHGRSHLRGPFLHRRACSLLVWSPVAPRKLKMPYNFGAESALIYTHPTQPLLWTSGHGFLMSGVLVFLGILFEVPSWMASTSSKGWDNQQHSMQDNNLCLMILMFLEAQLALGCWSAQLPDGSMPKCGSHFAPSPILNPAATANAIDELRHGHTSPTWMWCRATPVVLCRAWVVGLVLQGSVIVFFVNKNCSFRMEKVPELTPQYRFTVFYAYYSKRCLK